MIVKSFITMDQAVFPSGGLDADRQNSTLTKCFGALKIIVLQMDFGKINKLK